MSCADSNGQITMSREETTNWFGSYTMRSANGGRIAVVCRCPACLEVVEVLLLMAASSRGVDGSWKNGMREEYGEIGIDREKEKEEKCKKKKNLNSPFNLTYIPAKSFRK